MFTPTMEVLMDDEIESATVQSMYTGITEDDAGDQPPPATDFPPPKSMWMFTILF
jgi:hypothetical protein